MVFFQLNYNSKKQENMPKTGLEPILKSYKESVLPIKLSRLSKPFLCRAAALNLLIGKAGLLNCNNFLLKSRACF